MEDIILKIKLFCFLFLIRLTNSVIGQDIEYAREVINTLCDPAMHGRGYVNKGDSLAAAWISGEFLDIGLHPFEDNYYQEFVFPVNSFENAMSVQINGVSLIPGKDFLVDPGSPTLKGKFKVQYFDPDYLQNSRKLVKFLNNCNNRFVVFEPFKDLVKRDSLNRKIQDVIHWMKKDTLLQIAGIIDLTHEKLTWSVRNSINSRPHLLIKPEIVEDKIERILVNIQNKFYKAYRSRNVVGYIPGSESDSLVLITAHYDHLGRMGKDVYFPGANDNASGVAMMLDLARHIFKSDNIKYTVVFIAFAGEEAGLQGSRFFVSNPLCSLSSIKFMINLDLVGTGDEGITVVNGKIHEKEFRLLQSISRSNQYLPEIKARGEACNSDHCFFSLKGVPCFFIYTLGGIQAYHDIYDKPETLPLTNYENLFKLISSFLHEL